MKAKDLAHKLGVSTATISLVLNGKPGISDKTRTRIIKQIQDLGYGHLIQNASSSPIETNAPKTQSLGFVLFKNSGHLLGMNSFFPLILADIEATARSYGYNLIVINIEKYELESQIQYIADSGCSGYVIFATELQQEDLLHFKNLKIPFVLFDNYFIDESINSVKVNNMQGTYLAVKELACLGHKKIGYLSSGLPIRSFIERKSSALDAIRHFDLENPEPYCFTIGYPIENAVAGMNKLLSEIPAKKLPTAFLADNDLVSAGALKALKTNGFQIPDDISLIGFDNRPICTLVEPSLTTIELPRDTFGAEAVEQLIRLLRNELKSITKTEINGRLIRRESSGPAHRI